MKKRGNFPGFGLKKKREKTEKIGIAWTGFFHHPGKIPFFRPKHEHYTTQEGRQCSGVFILFIPACLYLPEPNFLPWCQGLNLTLVSDIYTLKNFKWTRMAISFWVRIYVICFSSEIYFLYQNGIHSFIKRFIFIWEWETPRSKFGMEFPFPNDIFILRVYKKADMLYINTSSLLVSSLDRPVIFDKHIYCRNCNWLVTCVTAEHSTYWYARSFNLFANLNPSSQVNIRSFCLASSSTACLSPRMSIFVPTNIIGASGLWCLTSWIH